MRSQRSSCVQRHDVECFRRDTDLLFLPHDRASHVGKCPEIGTSHQFDILEAEADRFSKTIQKSGSQIKSCVEEKRKRRIETHPGDVDGGIIIAVIFEVDQERLSFFRNDYVSGMKIAMAWDLRSRS